MTVRGYQKKVAISHYNSDGRKKRSGMRKAVKTEVRNRIAKQERRDAK